MTLTAKGDAAVLERGSRSTFFSEVVRRQPRLSFAEEHCLSKGILSHPRSRHHDFIRVGTISSDSNI